MTVLPLPWGIALLLRANQKKVRLARARQLRDLEQKQSELDCDQQLLLKAASDSKKLAEACKANRAVVESFLNKFPLPGPLNSIEAVDFISVGSVREELNFYHGWSYKADGSVNFFGDSLVRVDGAGGPDRTTRAYHFGLSLGA